MTRQYEKPVALRLMNLLGDRSSMEIQEDGIFLKQDWIDMAELGADWLNWTPQCALLQPGHDSRELLPIPFTARQLAAFMLCPVAGDFEYYVGQIGQLDASLLAEVFKGVQDGVPRLAIEEAQGHLAQAIARSGSNDSDALWLSAERMKCEYENARDAARERLGILSVGGHGLSDSEYTRRINQANEEVAQLKSSLAEERNRAEALGIDWLRRTTLAIFEDPQHRQIDDETAGFVEGFYSGLSLPAFVQMNSVAPLVAARLLLAKNPMEDSTQDDPEVKMLALVFDDVALFAPASRSMWNWVQIARERQVAHSTGIADYIEHCATAKREVELERADQRTCAEQTLYVQKRAVETVSAQKSWLDITASYVVEVMHVHQCTSAKDLYNKLHNLVDDSSPFDIGKGQNRGSLVIKKLNSTVSLKTFQNRWGEIRRLAA